MITSVLATTSRRAAQRAAISIHHGGVARVSQRHQPAAAAVHYFSTKEESSSGGGIRGWMEDRKSKKEQEQYLEQMARISNMEDLTLENYKKELERNLKGFFANISILQTKEIKLAKEVIEVVSSFIDVLGKDAQADDLINMGGLERLNVATSSNKTVEEIAIMVSQIQNMDLMQRTLKKRRLEGKPIPNDAQSMQAAIKKDALSVMTKAQKDMMKTRQAGMSRRMARKRK
jgi:hypothetical protein